MAKERDFLSEVGGEPAERKSRFAGLRKAAGSLKERIMYPDPPDPDAKPDRLVRYVNSRNALWAAENQALRRDFSSTPEDQKPPDH